MIQDIIVILVVSAAIIYMVRKIYLAVTGRGGCSCGCCDKCHTGTDKGCCTCESGKNDAKDDCCCKKD